VLRKLFVIASLSFVALLAVAVAILAPRVIEHRRVANSWCNLTRIGLALENYHAAHGSYPPAFVPDQFGRPMHSWRVLILPYLGYADLYKRYDFQEPWNSPKNRALSGEIPTEYRSPFPAREGDSTPYLAIVGAGTAWPGAKTTKHSDFTVSGKNTVLIVEVANSSIDWMEPRDMPFEQAIRGVHSNDTSGLSSYFTDGIHTLTAASNGGTLPVGIELDALASRIKIRPEVPNVPE